MVTVRRGQYVRVRHHNVVGRIADVNEWRNDGTWPVTEIWQDHSIPGFFASWGPEPMRFVNSSCVFVLLNDDTRPRNAFDMYYPIELLEDIEPTDVFYNSRAYAYGI